MDKNGKSQTSVEEMGRASSYRDPGGIASTLTWMIFGWMMWSAHLWPASQSLLSPRISIISEHSSSVELSHWWSSCWISHRHGAGDLGSGSGGGLGLMTMSGVVLMVESGSGGGNGAGMIAGVGSKIGGSNSGATGDKRVAGGMSGSKAAHGGVQLRGDG